MQRCQRDELNDRLHEFCQHQHFILTRTFRYHAISVFGYLKNKVGNEVGVLS